MLLNFETRRRLLDAAVEDGVVPGAVAMIGSRDVPEADETIVAGVRRLGGLALTDDTRFDLASLTKVVATLPALLALAGDGELDLDDRLGRFFSNAGWFQTPSLADATLRELLTHTSGLPAWRPLFAQVGSRLTARANLLQSTLEHEQGQLVYSDLGFLLLGLVIERVSGVRQDAYLQERLFGPLAMTETSYGPLAGVPVAATEDCGWRGRLLEGEVHDENAFVMEGVAGHAGLFATARDLARYARAWLSSDDRLAPGTLLAEATREQARDTDIRRGLGWQLASPGSSAGARASESAYGHTGFTGTSMWIDPVAGWFAVLLTNRVHPSRHGGTGIAELRKQFHESITDAFREQRA